MAQLNVYVPESLAQEIRRRARRAGKSLSQFISALVSKQSEIKPQWPKQFFTTVIGGWQGKLPTIPRPIPEEREAL